MAGLLLGSIGVAVDWNSWKDALIDWPLAMPGLALAATALAALGLGLNAEDTRLLSILLAALLGCIPVGASFLLVTV